MSDDGKQKEKKKISFRKSFVGGYEKLQANIPALVITCLSAFIVMGFMAIAIFLYNVRGAEKVLVPNVVGKTLEDGLLELQVKELYPTINLRYSEVAGDNGTILEQKPAAGAITKGYSRVSLVVSRGVFVDSVGDYVGENIEDVVAKLDTLFAGQQDPIIQLYPPEYKTDEAVPGTILEQDPPAGTSIYEPTKVQLVISRGPNYEETKLPNVVGQSVNDFLQTITRNKIIFDISYHVAAEGEEPGTIVRQQEFESDSIPTYSRVAVEMAMPSEPIDDLHYGVFTKSLIDYPYPVPMTISAVPAEGKSYTILDFNHVGGNLTIPYAVPAGTTLVLTVANKVQAKEVIN